MQATCSINAFTVSQQDVDNNFWYQTSFESYAVGYPTQAGARHVLQCACVW